MKQNERLLVYAVTGFLAIVLLVAVLFGPSGRDAVAKGPDVHGSVPTDGVRDLGEMLGKTAGVRPVPSAASTGTAGETGKSEKTEPARPEAGAAAPTNGAPGPADGGSRVANTPGNVGGVADILPPGQVSPQQPLVAADRSLLAVDLVARNLGASRRDRSVRLVRARSGDSLETLVRRWCGARDPYLEEARALNEDLVVLRVGQEVCVPWVDDETVLAAWEANKPKTLTPAAEAPPASPATSAGPAATVPTRPSFAEPGARTDAGKTPVPAPASEYTVKDGDSLWKIASRVYGRDNAARMVPELRKANPGAGDTLRVGQKLVLPAP